LSKLTEKVIAQALEFAYEKAVGGFAGADSAAALAETYKAAHPDDKRKQTDALIKKEIVKGASSGFVTGLFGLITLPVTIPANIVSVLFIQVRMVIAIAVIGGYDPKDEKVKSIIFSCLAGNAIKEVFKEAGVDVGKRMALKKIYNTFTGGTLARINRSIALKLIPKLSVNLGKWIPILGGVIGGAMDAVWVNEVGSTAKLIFIESGNIMDGDDAVQSDDAADANEKAAV
jgi:uncharacterized protein (DUF697 family)